MLSCGGNGRFKNVCISFFMKNFPVFMANALAYSLYFFSRPSVESTERFLGKAIRAVRSAE